MATEQLLVHGAKITDQILMVRGKRVMLDRDLAELYGVEVRVLNQAVTRNIERFPNDFMFKLSTSEMKNNYSLRSQIVILENGRGRYTKYPPRVFTEQGVAMLSSVLTSKRAVQVNIQIIRAFIHLRELLSTNAQLRAKIENMEKKYDRQLMRIFTVLQHLIAKESSTPKKIGFATSHLRAKKLSI